MFFQKFKGIIALDIDGTITSQPHELDSKVIDILTALAKEGWQVIFITGRPFQWGFATLEPLPFSYAFGVQNGALLLEMPSRNILMRKYLTQDILGKLDKIGRQFETDFVVYSGLENEDWCYYCLSSLPSSELKYGIKRAESLGEKWQSISSFSDLPVSCFSSVKFFAQGNRALLLSQHMEQELGLHAPPNRDPYNPDYFVIQATHPEANKGRVLQDYISQLKLSGPVIAAGDDHNDRSMLNVADIKIVMANAPPDLLAIADVIAPPASQLGIIQGLRTAIDHLKSFEDDRRV